MKKELNKKQIKAVSGGKSLQFSEEYYVLLEKVRLAKSNLTYSKLEEFVNPGAYEVALSAVEKAEKALFEYKAKINAAKK